MPVPSPFHEKTARLCQSMRWKDWAGTYAVCSYDSCHEQEYHALRQAAGLLDVSPLFKYDVTGPDAGAFLASVMVRDVSKLKVGQVAYTCWCDDDGKVLDDGTVTRVDESVWRVTAAEPALRWFQGQSRGFRVELKDATQDLAALALQGPASRRILENVFGSEAGALKFFRGGRFSAAGVPVTITRTGYTGDLGYEIWMEPAKAVKIWDSVMEAGRPFGLHPFGLDALDVARMEAGFILNGVDYTPANKCPIESRKSSPFELGLEKLVHLERAPFTGQEALLNESKTKPAWRLVGIVTDWDEYEALFARYQLPPQVPSQGWRTAVPVYSESGKQIGYASSGSWSPMLKKNLALAHIQAPWTSPGTEIRIEVTCEYARHKIKATVSPLPFFDPPGKRS